jgi:outer membrane protein OmpA-like peptidoglycan-associated protein
MPESRRPLILTLGLLLALAGLALWATSLSTKNLRERREARRQVTAALAEPGPSEKTVQLFRRARTVDPAYVACEKGMSLSADGQLAEAARYFDQCLQGDPHLAAAHRAWAESLLRARGREAFEEVRNRLRRFLETAEQESADPGEIHAIEELVLDVEDLLIEDSPAEHTGPWTVEELVDILSREGIRGSSRYDGPRVPLRFGFRPGEADLGAAAREQLRDVAKALQDGALARVVIQIEGHTDDTEAKPESARQALGTRRAEAVRDYLVREHGIPRERLKAVGFADQYPLEANRTAESRAANRRVELVNMETKEPVMRDARGRE